MTAIDTARATRSQIDDRLAASRIGRSLTREMDRDILALRAAGAAIDALIAEQQNLVVEMRARELHHFETEAQLIQAGLNPDAPPQWEYGIRASGDDEPYTDISEDLDYLLDGALAVTDEQVVRRLRAGQWAPVPVQQNRTSE